LTLCKTYHIILTDWSVEMFDTKNNKNKRIKILKAALYLFSWKGYHRTRIREIAEHAGVGKGTIYEYFKSKEDLFTSLITYVLKVMDEYAFQEVKPDMKASLKIKALVTGYLELVENMPREAIMVMTEFWSEGIRNHIKFDFRDTYKKYLIITRKILEEGIKKGEFKETVNVDNLSRSFLAFMDGILLHAMVFRRKEIDMKRIAEDFLDAIFKGIRRR